MKIVKQLFQNLPTAVLTVFFILFSLGQLQRVQLTHDTAFYLHDAVIILFLLWDVLTEQKIITSVQKIIRNWKKIQQRYQLELVWLGWILLGMVLGGLVGRVTVTALLYLTRIAAYLTFIWLANQKKQAAYGLKKGFLAAGTLMGAWGLLQYLLIPDTRFLHIFGWDNHYYRLIGTLFDPAFMGMALVLTFGLWHMPKIVRSIPEKWHIVAQVMLTIALAATFSRASYAAFFVLLGFLWLAKKIRWQACFMIFSIFLAAVVLLPKPGGEGVNLSRTSTAQARVNNSQQGLSAISGAQWLWGRGLFNNDVTQQYETPSHAQLPDSLLVLSLNATGIGGTIVSLLLLKKWLPRWWKNNPVWASMLLAVLVHSLFNNTLLQPFIFLMLWGSKNKN